MTSYHRQEDEDAAREAYERGDPKHPDSGPAADVRPAGRFFPIVPPNARGCPARVPANRNLWRYCMRPYGHEGGHIFDD